MTDKKKKVYNIYEVGKRDIDAPEVLDHTEILVDQSLKVPTLQDYIESYTNGVPLPYVDNGEEYEDDDEEFKPQDYRNCDIEDLKEYNENLQTTIKANSLKNNSKTEKVPENKEIVENTKEKVPDDIKK